MPRNVPAFLIIKVVKDGVIRRILDDELEQIHDKVQVVQILHEVAENGPIPSLLVRGPDLLNPGRRCREKHE